ncbi:uncharacterized protein DUF3971 [Martelella mediterranea]|uniref:Uncharacterized protein DUF3971 n=1 Tax=Martelella mediterranea TaxID=293089 RepID=A0A4R3NU00_9HYPH|nr:uncharacterized protein DUF3971 [Martelella mediterranea]
MFVLSRKRRNDPYIRGEKTHFSRREWEALHALPSAQAHEPTIVHCKPRRTLVHACARMAVLISLLVAILLALAVYIIESGSLDRFLSAEANQQIRNAMPDGYHARIASTKLRLGSGLNLQLKIDGVEMLGSENVPLAAIGEMAFSLDPWRLMLGQVSINSVSASDINFNSAALPSTGTFRLTEHRVDTLPLLVEQIFDRTDFARGILTAADTRIIKLSNIAFPVGSASPGQTVAVSVQSATFSLLSDGVMRADGEILLDDETMRFSAEALAKDGRTGSLQAEVRNLDLTPFLLRGDDAGKPVLGLEGAADVALSLERADSESDPEAYAEVAIGQGRFVADTIARDFENASLNLTYDTTKNSIELSDSSIDFDGSVFPFSGGIIDLDRIDNNPEPGYGLDFLVSGGRFKSREPGMPPLIFDAKFSGEYHGETPKLLLDNIAVSSPQGVMAGSFKAVFGDASPELSFGARIEHMDTEAVKQLWPFWIARKPREWVSRNLHGGRVASADLAVFIPEGRMEGVGVPLELDDSELRLKLNIEDTRITLNNTFPDVMESDARVSITGSRVDVEIDDGRLSVDKGRSVDLDSGTFTIADAYEKPLTGQVDVNLSGAVENLIRLAAAPPINALNNTDFAVDDFSGRAVVNVKSNFMLETDSSTLPANWAVSADIEDVALSKPIRGYTVGGLTGVMRAQPSQIAFDGSGSVSGMPVDINWREPLGSAESDSGSLTLTGDISEAQRKSLLPGLGQYVGGPVSLTLDSAGDDSRVALDLTRTVLSMPPLGWKKASGVPATLTFNLGQNGDHTVIENLVFNGAGFSATGLLNLDKDGLDSATLTNVALSEGDNLNLAVSRTQGGYDVTVTGKQFLAQNLLTRLTGEMSGATDGTGGTSDNSGLVDLSYDIGRVIGMNNRPMSHVNGDMLLNNGKIQTATFDAFTATGQPLSAFLKGNSGSKNIQLNTSGTGELLRFLGIYQKMTGGTLNVNMSETAAGWQGIANLNTFWIVRDEQLKRMLSAPTGRDGKSLNATYRNQINQTDQRFQKAQAAFDISNGVFRVTDAFVRGDQVGATFKGIVRDAAGNIDITGTFMPAYSLNRIFAEIPLLGPILGNGQDKGLFGITFRLTGKTAKPELIINPLSAIAPGVFRRIFEFQQND